MSNVKKLMMSAAGGESPAKYLITHGGGSNGSYACVWDIQNNYNEVTSTFIPSGNQTAWAGSQERMNHGWQDNGYRGRYIGFGGWGRYGATGGSILEVNSGTGLWTSRANYDGNTYTFGTSGNASAIYLVPHGNGSPYFWWKLGDYDTAGVANITTTAAVSGTDSELTQNTTDAGEAWGNFLLVQENDGSDRIQLFSFNSSTGATSNLDNDSLSNAGSSGFSALKVSKSGNVIVSQNSTSVSTRIKIWDQYHISDYNGNSPAMTGNGTVINCTVSGFSPNAQDTEAIGISDDDRWVVVSETSNSSPYWSLVAIDRDNSYSVTRLTCPTGNSNARPRDIVFYPDNDTFFVAGYSGCQNSEFKISNGGYTRNLDNFGPNSESIISGSAMGCTVLPEDWLDGLN